MTAGTTYTCAICGEAEADRRLLHECFRCGQLYHLNPYSNQPGKDCGDAVLEEEFGLYYYCNPCLREVDEEYRASVTPAPLPEAPAPPSEQRPPPSGLPPRTERDRPRRRYRRADGA